MTFTKEQALNNLKGLIRRYNENRQDNEYIKNEQRICDNLIIPFFKLVLGWNPETEFISQSVQGGKRVDYLVVLDSISQFVIEAKSLSHDIKGHHQYYQQAIQYAQYKEKKFAILTNFKKFIVLDAEIETEPLKAEVAAIDIEKLNGQFDILWAFSKDIWKEKGESNEILLKLKGKKKQKIDEQLLDDLKKWRMLLLNNLKKYTAKNKYDFEKDINYIEEEVQKFIDRLVFICYCEDKQLMDVELRPIISDKENDKNWDKPNYIIGRISKLFDDYNNKYNSDLFVKGWCDDFYFDDHSLIQVLKDLRQPKGKLPYDFSIIEADILGKTYENFIGHVLSSGKRIKEKESKGKRKEMGIYYTPTYIVDYIVRNTVGEYIKGMSISSIMKVRIIDPACGSGSFLIRAFDLLAEEVRKIRNVKELGYEDKKNIMLNCIHGVDKDERAVDICKLNLSLKLATQGKPLPELHNNIKCGDSLIDDEAIAGDKAFNWNEKFKSIMDNGGFDVVIGNPPYVSVKIIPSNEKAFYINKYYSAKGQFDLYGLFIEKSLNILKEKGLFSMITSNTFLSNVDFQNLREIIIKKTKVKQIIDLRETVFKDANLDVTITIVEKCAIEKDRYSNKILIIDHPDKFSSLRFTEVNQNNFLNSKGYLLKTHFEEKTEKILKKIFENSIHLKDLVTITRGIEKGSNECESKAGKNYVPILVGKDISRYTIDFNERYIKYDEQNKSDFKKRQIFESSKILVQRIRNLSLKRRLISTLDLDKYYCMNTLRILLEKNKNFSLKYILAILNSKLINYYFLKSFNNKDIYAYQLETIPIKNIPPEKQLPFIKLADKMLSLNKKLQEIGDKNTMEKQKIEEEIKKTDNEIDELVYQLYEITEEEKKIIEESLK